MINDGGAERMVKSNKITWYQIVVIIVMVVIVAIFGAFIYFTYNGEQLVRLIDRSTLKDGYDLLKDVKAQFEDVAVYGYEQSEEQVSIEFRYYEEVLEKDTDLLELSYQVKSSIEDYLAAHPEDAINQKQKKLDLRFPDVHYSNFDLEGTESYVFSTSLNYVTYEYSGITATEFMNRVGSLQEAQVLTIRGDGTEPLFSEDVDFSGLTGLEGLRVLRIVDGTLSEAQRETLEALKLTVTVQ
jgi:hypothetical protein